MRTPPLSVGRLSRRILWVSGLFFLISAAVLTVLTSSCASTASSQAELIHGQVVDARTGQAPSGQLRYFLTFEYRERVGQGSFNRVTLEVDQLEWMRFHSGGEFCVIPRMEGMSLRNCS